MATPTPSSWFQCIEGCARRFPLTEIIYSCPTCGNLLEVQHDIETLRTRSGAEWRQLMDGRVVEAAGPKASGVWSLKEWVYSDLADQHIVTIAEGRTPLFDAKVLSAKAGVDNVWIKLCGNSHTGSFKDLGMTVLVSAVKRIVAEAQPIKAVVCASTGDTSAALAAYCAAGGIPAIVLLPRDKISTAQLIQPISNGTHTFSLDCDFDGCMAIVKQLTENHELYLANSMNSLRVEGQKTVAVEIVQQLQWRIPDWIVVPGGNLGNVSAIGKGLLEMQALGVIDRLPRLVCAQTELANPLYESYRRGFEHFAAKPAGRTLATAIQIGNPVSFKKAIRVLKKFDGIVEQVSEVELAEASALTDRCGLFVCPQTGVAVAAFLKLVEKGEIKNRDRVVVISTAHGLKFTDFKIRYHERRLADVRAQWANPPHQIAADAQEITNVLEQVLSSKTT